MFMPKLSTMSIICSSVGRFTDIGFLHYGFENGELFADAYELVDETVVVQFVRLRRAHDRALLDDEHALRQGGDEFEILFDEDHRKPALFAQALQRLDDLVDD